MCQGSTHHIINGDPVILQQGELLFLNQNATQEIYPAGETDIAVNFIILPEFFDHTLQVLDERESNQTIHHWMPSEQAGKHWLSAF